MGKRVVVVGSSFAGMTAAIEIKRRLGEDHDVICVSRSEQFVFQPSLVWLALGLRDRKDIAFDVEPVLHDAGVAYLHANVTELDLRARAVVTPRGRYAYDYLVIATGPKVDDRVAAGLGLRDGFVHTIVSASDAERARLAFDEFLGSPGPIVVGAAQGASVFSAAYEYLFNVAHRLDELGLRARSPVTFVTAEPFLGHLGIGGFGDAERQLRRVFDRLGVPYVTNACVERVTEREVVLADGSRHPFGFAMFVPPFVGVDAIRACADVTDDQGFVVVDDTYRTAKYPEVFAAGVAVSMPPPHPTPVPCGVPKTGYMSEEMGRVVAHNVVASIRGERLVSLPPAAIDAKFVLDAGDTGLIMTSDRWLEPRDHAWLLPGPEAHWAKIAWEKWFLASRRRGRV